ncbi:DNA repair protein XRCC4-like isoform X1 [Ptychodera flava]|uniref:DNA repair protein XRCC4-like isoform X1 n=1 Tax=Ptychodera flava TaxID=63121 RepID=UPI00396A567D
MARKTLCKLEAGTDEYFLLTTLHEEGEDGFTMALTDGSQAWTGEISIDELESLASDIKMDASEYINQTCKALTREKTGQTTFQYQVKKYKGESIEFSWKKVMDTDRIKFQLGSVVLEKASDTTETVKEIFDFSIEKMGSLHGKISTLEADNARLSAERGKALKRLEKCVELKENMEKDLYGKFQVLVNDKKAKIRQLKEEVTDARRYANSSQSSSRAAANEAESDTDKEENTDKEDNADEDMSAEETTDEEEKKTLSKGKRKVVVSKTLAGDGLVLSDDEVDTAPAPSSKRRRIRQPTQKKETPSKPSIPKIPSKNSSTASESSVGGRRRSSSRKSSSIRTTESPDDLLGEL